MARRVIAMGDEYVTVGEAARLLEVHRNTIRNWIDQGYLVARRLPSGHYRVSVASIQRLLDSHDDDG